MNADEIRDLIADDYAHLWHPYTGVSDYLAEEPLIIERGQGVWLEDVHGNRYLDGIGSIWLNVHGHQVPEIDGAIREQLGRVAHATILGQANVPAIRLARELVAVAPEGLSRVFLSDSGAEAVEVGLKIAVQYWANRGRPEKRRLISMDDAYHGDTLGAVSLGAIDLFHGAFRPLLFEPVKVPYPNCYRCPFGLRHPACRLRCLEPVEEALRRHGQETAALVVEPVVQGVGGILVMPEGYLAELARLARRHEVLLLADEVATGFGRTGTLFAVQREGVTPDLMALGKGLTGGYLPVSATLATEEVFSAFVAPYADRRTFFHGHSFAGNPLGCAAALASLRLMPERLADLPQKSRQLFQALEPLREHPLVGDIRGTGLMAGVELVRDKDSKASFAWEDRVGQKVARSARRRGLLMRPLGPVLVLMPPLSSSGEELGEMASRLALALGDVTEDIREVADRG